jgi:hypothetical protein
MWWQAIHLWKISGFLRWFTSAGIGQWGWIGGTYFDLFWNERMERRAEGRVEDESGEPTHVWMMLINADGKRLAG